jgi:enoyl-CoA hydratase
MLIDKDKAPRWQPGTIGEVDDAEVDRYFSSLAEGELGLKSREAMQSLP